MTVNPELSAGYFRGVARVVLPAVFPRLFECPAIMG